MSVSAANNEGTNAANNMLRSPFLAQIICNNGDVRLADGVSNIEGRVEFCNNGVWGTICHHQWGPSDAKVVCRQLGLPTTRKM